MSVTAESGRSARIDSRWLPYAFLLPSAFLLAGVMLYPLLSGLYYSLSHGSLLATEGFVGLRNYVDLLTLPDFWNAFRFTAIFSFFGVAGSYLVGLGFALILNQRVPGRGVFRVALLIPWVVPAVVSIASWRWMLGTENGSVNVVLHALGLGPVQFLSNEGWAMFSVILIKIWRSFPFMMISCLAALQAIDRDLYEAASIDGAGRWRSFWHITVPHIRTISTVMWILMTIWCFNDFETIYLLTQGGPSNATENLIVVAYRYTFAKNDLGTGSAMAVVSLLVLMALAVLLLRGRDKDTERTA
jgi:multiple sugar transport system permease protein